MSTKRLQTAAFYLVDANDYKTFSQLRQENLKLQKQISELMKYRDLHSSALQTHFESKLQELHNKLRKREKHTNVSTETLEPHENTEVTVQSGAGLSNDLEESSVNVPPEDNESLIQKKLLSAFENFLQKTRQECDQTGAGDDDLTPQLALPLGEPSNAPSILEQKDTTKDGNNSESEIPALQTDGLLSKVPLHQQNKAKRLLQELASYSSDLSFSNDGQVILNGKTLPNLEAATVLSQLYRPIKFNTQILPVVDEIASLGLGHLIARHYTRGITPRGSNYLKNRKEIRDTLHPFYPWYYISQE